MLDDKQILHSTILHKISIELHVPGEVVDQNFGRYVPPRFSKIGSSELIFWLGLWGLWNEILLKFVSHDLKI